MKKEEKQQIQYINHGTDEQMEIYGYTGSLSGLIVTWIFIVLSVGFLRLVFYWKPNWLILCTHKQCPIKHASIVLLRVKTKIIIITNFNSFKLNVLINKGQISTVVCGKS